MEARRQATRGREAAPPGFLSLDTDDRLLRVRYAALSLSSHRVLGPLLPIRRRACNPPSEDRLRNHPHVRGDLPRACCLAGFANLQRGGGGLCPLACRYFREAMRFLGGRHRPQLQSFLRGNIFRVRYCRGGPGTCGRRVSGSSVAGGKGTAVVDLTEQSGTLPGRAGIACVRRPLKALRLHVMLRRAGWWRARRRTCLYPK